MIENDVAHPREIAGRELALQGSCPVEKQRQLNRNLIGGSVLSRRRRSRNLNSNAELSVT
ncbi:MAG: hypothetical protein CMJ47_13730 [Planctomyces sp.]|nr:hypothetical protein [Planctomyces sp.]